MFSSGKHKRLPEDGDDAVVPRSKNRKTKNRRTLKTMGLMLKATCPLDAGTIKRISQSLIGKEKLLDSFIITNSIIYIEYTKGRNVADWPTSFYKVHGIAEETIQTCDVKFCLLYEVFDKDAYYISHNFDMAKLEKVMSDKERLKKKTRTMLLTALTSNDILQTGLCSAEQYPSVRKFKETVSSENVRENRKRVPPGGSFTLRFKNKKAVRVYIPHIRYETEKACKYYYSDLGSNGVRFEDIRGFTDKGKVILKKQQKHTIVHVGDAVEEDGGGGGGGG